MRVLEYLLLWVAAAVAVGHCPLGVNFGMKYITAAYSTAANKTIPVAKVEGSKDYQKHMERLASDSQKIVVSFKKIYLKDGDDLLPAPQEYHGYGQNDKKIIRDTLKQVMDTAAHKVGHSIRITAANIPLGLDNIAWRHLAGSLIDTDVAPDLAYLGQLVGYLNAARLAYGLTKSESLGHRTSFDLTLDRLNMIVYVDYNSYSLDFWTADVLQETVSMIDDPHNQARYPELGALKLNLTDGAGKIQGAMKQFLSGLESSNDGPYVRAVMVGGEGSSSDMDHIRRMVNEALLPDWKPLLRDQIDPFYICAIGAAHRAREWVLTPDSFKHDEL